MTEEQHPAAGGDHSPSGAVADTGWAATGSGAARELLATLVTGFEDSAGRCRGVDTPLTEAVAGTVTEALAMLSTIEQLRGVLAHTEATWLMEADARLRGARTGRDVVSASTAAPGSAAPAPGEGLSRFLCKQGVHR